VAEISVSLTIVNAVTFTPSMRTAVALVKSLPVIVIVSPPAADPESGVTELRVGVVALETIGMVTIPENAKTATNNTDTYELRLSFSALYLPDT
jgi:hypothetical protein